jgi:hypothetical protein
VAGTATEDLAYLRGMAPRAIRCVPLALLVALASACSMTPELKLPRTATQQVLATEAIDRALEQFEFPDVVGRRVAVYVGAPGDAVDGDYLRVAVQIALLEAHAIVVPLDDDPDLVLAVLVGAMGLDQAGRFFGIEGTAGGFIPFTIPEVALYKKVRMEGFAKAEYALVDPHTGAVVHRSAPAQGDTWAEQTTLLLIFSWGRTDTSRLD